MHSDPTLKRFYCWSNRQYFGGQLPEEDVYVCWEATGRGVAETFVLDEMRVVRVDPSEALHDCHWKLGIIHEQIHIYLDTKGLDPRAHGRHFDEERKRLCGYRSYRNLL